MAGNSCKDPARIAGRSTRRSTSISWLFPRVFSLSNMAPVAPESSFLRGEGKKWWVPGRGKGKCLFLKGVSFNRVSFHFHGKSLFLCKRLISTAEAHFYGGGVFLQRRHIYTVEAHFYSGGIFLRRRYISTAEAYFYGGGVSLRRKCISMKEVNLKAIGLSIVWKRGTNSRCRWVFV